MNEKQQKKYQQALSKAELFFAKQNYPLAKRYFETMLRLNPELIKDDDNFAEKIKLCKQQTEIQQQKTLIKKAQNLEKKDKIGPALEHFEKALILNNKSTNAESTEKEVWIKNKIKQLKNKSDLSLFANLVSETQHNNDPETQVLTCKKLLEKDPHNSEIIKQLAQCYVKLTHYNQAIKLFLETDNFSDSDNYYLGYAYLQTDQLLSALTHWTLINPLNKQAIQVFSQLNQLLPYAVDSLKKENTTITNRGEILKNLYHYISLFENDQENTIDKSSIQSLYLKHLWKTQQYNQIHQILSPMLLLIQSADHKQNISLDQLELYAKLYFKLASEDKSENSQYLEYAISFYLSAIYNDKLIHSLASFQLPDNKLETSEVQAQLFLKLDTLIIQYKKDKQLPKTVETVWKTEKKIVQLLSRLGNKSKTFKKNIRLEFYPCSPVFARMFKLNEEIYQLIVSNKRYLMGKNSKLSEDEFYELCCYFTPLAEFMLLAVNNKELEALKLLSKTQFSNLNEPELINYCHQKIAFQYAIRLLKKGANNFDKYLLNALPLIKKYPSYAKQLCSFALSDKTRESCYIELATVMERLSKQIETPDFMQATAYIMAMKAIQMSHDKISRNVIKKLLDKAIEIDPNSLAVKEVIEHNKEDLLAEQLSKAFKKNNLHQASTIVQQSNSDDLKSFFFETMAYWSRSPMIYSLEEEEQLIELKELHIHCTYIDRNHPVTLTIGNQIEQYKKQK